MNPSVLLISDNMPQYIACIPFYRVTLRIDAIAGDGKMIAFRKDATLRVPPVAGAIIEGDEIRLVRDEPSTELVTVYLVPVTYHNASQEEILEMYIKNDWTKWEGVRRHANR